ncbi:cell envelope integrity EipB family protein [Rhizobium halophytocola]|uniref:DUF1849 family protein n=1 Tax=Rhizobium halophytocola TaxID=735519 RepID=A0ABS4DW70_9HYPH|nr:cell envelope integrity EipB family protein [Rhizobium halophytocola]MBP1849941.1 hypothetical protein [Rhizobium halophytocola]
MKRATTAIALSVGALSLCIGTDGARAGVGEGLIGHRAVYDVALQDASDRSGIEGLEGRLVYQFSGTACSGYTTNFRFVNRIDTGDDVRITDQQSVMYEDVKSGRFEFETKSFTDQRLDKGVSGAAQEDDKGIKINLTKPDQRMVEIADSRFPAAHMIEIIKHAERHQHIFETRIFDGSEDGDIGYLTTVVVGDQEKPKKPDAETRAMGKDLASMPYWPVSIAYYDDKNPGDQLPVYTQTFKLYENGITRDLTLDYGDFVLKARLKTLDVLDDGACH